MAPKYPWADIKVGEHYHKVGRRWCIADTDLHYDTSQANYCCSRTSTLLLFGASKVTKTEEGCIRIETLKAFWKVRTDWEFRSVCGKVNNNLTLKPRKLKYDFVCLSDKEMLLKNWLPVMRNKLSGEGKFEGTVKGELRVSLKM